MYYYKVRHYITFNSFLPNESYFCFFSDDATMGGRRGGRATHAGELSVNKKGTPLYSREDIREQYCINDKELQVLDKSQRKSLLGCFSNQGQASLCFIE